MTKNMIPHILWAVALAGIYYLHLTDKEKVAYVDSVKLLAEYRGMADAQQAYQKKAIQWQANIDTLKQEMQVVQAKYQEQKTLKTTTLAQTEQELKSKQQQLVNYQRAIQEKVTQEDQQMTQQVLSQVNSLVEEYGKKHGYRVILVANGSGTIAYAQEGADLTSELLKVLNEAYIP
ncbi:OmpH family outer membrane protein [Tunicatimonas pelagia]|uniref:OmpH family outer membrane protein n=1 Tax=Tunicatimonas pelagia TaxID=931531 RepID=UPI002666BC57|nr:OmpH family outer membrane protein [Tunicatimonas pelagia]WKN45338.1 OmpH family outer membrane protein [Tunicatimonas pelagia]